MDTCSALARWWFSYLGAKFYGIWADNRDGSTTARLRGAYFNE
jgi:hypothetical protein